MKTLWILLAFVFLGLISSCTKEDAAEETATTTTNLVQNASDTEAPVILVISPKDNTSFSKGSTVLVQGTVSDNEGIESITVTVKQKLTGLELYKNTTNTADLDSSTSHSVNDEVVVASIVPNGTYILEIEAEDLVGNTTTFETEVEITSS